MKKTTTKKGYSTLITMKNKLKNSHGFTLIELMITVAIVGILSAVALPAYQDYVARSQVSEGLTLVSGAKPVIAEYYSNHGSYPTSSDIGFNGYTGSYVGTTTIGADGAIVATFSNDAHRQLRGQTVTLTPEEVEETGNLRWNCSSSVDSKFLPTSCSNDGSSGNPGNGGTDPTDPGGENPGGGETDPFTQTFTYQSGYWTYNGDGTISDTHGNTFTGTLSGDEMVFTNSSGNIMKINKDGYLTEESKAWGQTAQYDVKQTYSKDSTNSNYAEYSGQIQFSNTTINGIDYAGNFPSYIDIFDFDSTGFQTYQNFYSATDALKQRINATPSGDSFLLDNEALNNYNTAKQNYISFLNQQKTNGTQLSQIDELLLSKSL